MFKTRLKSSVVLVIALVILLLSGDAVLAVSLMLISMVGYRELTKACGVSPVKGEAKTEGFKEDAKKDDGAKENGASGKEGRPGWSGLEIAGLVGIVAYYLAVYFTDRPELWMAVLAAEFLACMAVYVFRYPKYRAEQVMDAFFAFFYAPVLFSFIYLTRALDNGIYLVWMIFVSSWICDTCAYCVGMLLGKHRLAPVLSPKKSVEGALGGVAGSAIVGAAFGYFCLKNIYGNPALVWIAAVIAAAGAVLSQVGDLAASGIKRNHGIKDYGKLIPGHGGIMDRFDSVLFTAPVIYFLTIFMIG